MSADDKPVNVAIAQGVMEANMKALGNSPTAAILAAHQSTAQAMAAHDASTAAAQNPALAQALAMAAAAMTIPK